MNCERKEGIPPDVFECAKCGRPFKLQPHGIGLPVYRQCGEKTGLGLGDIVAAGLELTGLAYVARRLRLCRRQKCKERQEVLNELGKKVGL